MISFRSGMNSFRSGIDSFRSGMNSFWNSFFHSDYDVCAVKDVVISFNLPHFYDNSNLTVFGAEVSRVMSLCGGEERCWC